MKEWPSSPYQAKIEELEEENFNLNNRIIDLQNLNSELIEFVGYIRDVVFPTIISLINKKQSAYVIRFIKSIREE